MNFLAHKILIIVELNFPNRSYKALKKLPERNMLNLKI